MRITPEIEGASVVLRGNFNPAIFTPAWFVLHGLLPESAATNAAELTVAHKQVTQFNFDWLQLVVSIDQFRAETVQAPHIRVHDLVVRVFKEYLNHTPLTAFGINRDVHFQAGSLAARDQLGRTLAPTEPWGDWGKELGLDGNHGGMTSLTMTQVGLEGRHAGDQINVKVEPSARIGDGQTGVYIQVNDHYVVSDTSPTAAGHSIGLLERNFETSLERSEEIIDYVMSLVPDRKV